MGITWTEPRIELLKKLWAEGLSKKMIAPLIASGCTPNAVGGKAFHLNLPKRTKTEAGRPRIHTPGMAPALSKPVPLTISQYRPVPQRQECDDDPLYRKTASARHKGNALLTAEEDGCRWPIGDPRAANFRFCGKKRVKYDCYCEMHKRKAHSPPALQPRRKEKADV